MGRPPSCLLLFLDGVGIGTDDRCVNPFFSAPCERLTALCNGRMIHTGDPLRKSNECTIIPLDATLGVGGLPQSGTGQTALYTGVNAAAEIGKHFGPYPSTALRPLLERENIFRRLQKAGKKPFFANAYPEQFFRYIGQHPGRNTATAQSWRSTGLPFNDHERLRRGEAVSADITNGRWAKLGYPDIATITPREAGKRLGDLTRDYDFVLFEYYYTDHAGHSQSASEAEGLITAVDHLIDGILGTIDRTNTLLVVTSDHGNMEDLSTKSHTRNPVPLIAVGAGHRKFAAGLTDLTHVAPAIMKYLI